MEVMNSFSIVFKCRFCFRVFLSRSSLDDHIKKHTATLSPVSDSGRNDKKKSPERKKKKSQHRPEPAESPVEEVKKVNDSSVQNGKKSPKKRRKNRQSYGDDDEEFRPSDTDSTISMSLRSRKKLPSKKMKKRQVKEEESASNSDGDDKDDETRSSRNASKKKKHHAEEKGDMPPPPAAKAKKTKNSLARRECESEEQTPRKRHTFEEERKNDRAKKKKMRKNMLETEEVPIDSVETQTCKKRNRNRRASINETQDDNPDDSDSSTVSKTRRNKTRSQSSNIPEESSTPIKELEKGDKKRHHRLSSAATEVADDSTSMGSERSPKKTRGKKSVEMEINIQRPEDEEDIIERSKRKVGNGQNRKSKNSEVENETMKQPSTKKKGRKLLLDAETSTAPDMDSSVAGEDIAYHLLETNTAIASSKNSQPESEEETATPSEFKVPLSDVEVSLALKALKCVDAPKSVKILQPVLKIAREPFNEITISPAVDGKIEILYTGLKKGEYSEWRCETVERFGKRKSLKTPTKAPLPLDEQVTFALPCQTLQVVNIDGLTDDIHSILDILTGQKMTTISLDGCLSLKINKLREKLTQKGKFRHKIVFLPSVFLPILQRSQNPKELHPNMMFLPKEELHDALVIAPILSCKHFYLTVFDFPNHAIYIYDSSWGFLPLEYRFYHANTLLKVLVSRNMPDPCVKAQSWKVYFMKDCAQQIDDHSCGCYVMYFAENHILGDIEKSNSPLSPSQVKAIRQDMARKLLATTNIGKQILETICY